MASNEVSWAAEVAAADTEPSAQNATPSQETETSEQLKLPDIPKEFDPEEYDPPEPIIIKKADNTFLKASWRVIIDPKASANDEYPPEVIEQTIEHFKVETQRVNKRVAARRRWAKYGQSEQDGSGPNAGTTNRVLDDIPITLMSKRHAARQGADTNSNEPVLTQDEEQDLKKTGAQVLALLLQQNLIGQNQGVQKSSALGEGTPGKFQVVRKPQDAGSSGPGGPSGTVDNRPPRPGRPGRGAETMGGDEGYSLRVSNLSENITEGDIHDLFGQCGRLRRVFLARDRRTRMAKGFGYVTYDSKRDAEKAIRMLNKYTYDYLVLGVEWSLKKD